MELLCWYVLYNYMFHFLDLYCFLMYIMGHMFTACPYPKYCHPVEHMFQSMLLPKKEQCHSHIYIFVKIESHKRLTIGFICHILH